MNIIIPLSASALKYAVELCEATPNIKVGVALSNYSDIDSTFDKMTDYVDCCQFKQFGTSIEKYIDFKNGSQIRIVVPTENMKGSRWNMLILDESIDDKIFRKVLKRCVTR